MHRLMGRWFRLVTVALFGATLLSLTASAQVKPTVVVKNGYEFELRSDTKIMLDQLASSGHIIPLDEPFDAPGNHDGGGLKFRGANLQVNNPAFDSIQIFPGFRPFVHSTESETSVAAFGRTVVATYNSSAGMHLIPNPGGPGLVFDRLQISGFSTSTDGGKTFTSGFFPGVQGIPFSFGDPSVDVDRRGNFYFAQLGQDVAGNGAITVNKSSDGLHWNDAVVAALDDNGDKEWLAVGPDPFKKQQENVYVTWTSFQDSGAQLRLAKSTDGGVTWTSKTIYAPAANNDPTLPQNSLSFSNPVVDRSTGTLYVPFAHFSNADSDFIQMLISEDGGATFRFVEFNISGAPDATLLPIVQPGELIECGATLVAPKTFAINLRLTLHAGPNIGGSLTGLPRFVNATRLIVQPSIAVRDGVVYLAWNTSTSPFFGDPSGTSNIMFMRSDNGGKSWGAPVRVNTTSDPHHVHPSLSISNGDEGDEHHQVHVSYYTQHTDGSLDLNLSTSNDGGRSFRAENTVEISSTPFALPPTNIPIPSRSNPFAVTNYDRLIQPCYALGEYQSVKTNHNRVYVLWGDSRTTITEPVNSLDPVSGTTHPQEDAFIQVLQEED